MRVGCQMLSGVLVEILMLLLYNGYKGEASLRTCIIARFAGDIQCPRPINLHTYIWRYLGLGVAFAVFLESLLSLVEFLCSPSRPKPLFSPG